MKLEADAERVWIPIEGRPIQIAAAGRGLLFVETNDGRLFLWKDSSGLPEAAGLKAGLKELHFDFMHQAGSSFCWDGMYLWVFESDAVYATTLLPNYELVRIPESAYPRADFIETGTELLAVACGWMNSQGLLRYGGPLQNSAISNEKFPEPIYVLVEGILNKKSNLKRPWPLQGRYPLAVTLAGPERIVALAAQSGRAGSFELLLWN